MMGEGRDIAAQASHAQLEVDITNSTCSHVVAVHDTRGIRFFSPFLCRGSGRLGAQERTPFATACVEQAG